MPAGAVGLDKATHWERKAKRRSEGPVGDIGRGRKEDFKKCSVLELGMSLGEWGVEGR